MKSDHDMPGATSTACSQSSASRILGPWWHRLILLAFVAFGLGTYFALYSPPGMVIIASNDPTVRLRLRSADHIIVSHLAPVRLPLPPGHYQVEIAHAPPGTRLSTEQFTLDRRGRAFIFVTTPQPRSPQY